MKFRIKNDCHINISLLKSNLIYMNVIMNIVAFCVNILLLAYSKLNDRMLTSPPLFYLESR